MAAAPPRSILDDLASDIEASRKGAQPAPAAPYKLSVTDDIAAEIDAQRKGQQVPSAPTQTAPSAGMPNYTGPPLPSTAGVQMPLPATPPTSQQRPGTSQSGMTPLPVVPYPAASALPPPNKPRSQWTKQEFDAMTQQERAGYTHAGQQPAPGVPAATAKPAAAPPPSGTPTERLAPATPPQEMRLVNRKLEIPKNVLPTKFPKPQSELDYAQAGEQLKHLPPALAQPGHAAGIPVQEMQARQTQALAQWYNQDSMDEIEKLDDASVKLQGLTKQINDMAAAGKTPPKSLLVQHKALRLGVEQRNQEISALEHQYQQLSRGPRPGGIGRHAPIHGGMQYPEEVAAGVNQPGMAERLLEPVSGTAAALQQLPAIRAGLQWSGRFPMLPAIPYKNRQQGIDEKNVVLDAITTLGDRVQPDGTVKLAAAATPDLRSAAAQLRHLTPFQQQVLPVLLQQRKAEKEAAQIAGLGTALKIDIGSQIAAEGLAPVIGGLIRGPAKELVKRFAPELFVRYAAASAPTVAELTAPLSREALNRFLVRSIPRIAIHAATGGGVGSIVSGGATLAAGGTPAQARAAALRGMKAGAIFAGGTSALMTGISGTLRSGWNPQRSPQMIEDLVQGAQAAGLDATDAPGLRDALTQATKAPAATRGRLFRQIRDQFNLGGPAKGAGAPRPPQGAGEVIPPEPTAPPPPNPRETPTETLQQQVVQGDVAAHHALVQREAWDVQQNAPLALDRGTVTTYARAWLGSAEKKQYDALQSAAAGNPALAAQLQQAAHELQKDHQYQWARQNAPDMVMEPEIGPPQVSVWRQMSPAERDVLPAPARRVLLLQDVANSARTLDPKAAITPPKIKDAALEKYADQQFSAAQQKTTPATPIGTPIPTPIPEQQQPAATVPATPQEMPATASGGAQSYDLLSPAEKASVDDLLPQARQFIAGGGDSSTAALQRHFRIGYTGASALKERLAAQPAQAPAAPETAATVQAPPAAPMGAQKPLWEMSATELDAAHATAKTADRDLLNRIFGEEGAKRYQTLERKANSTTLTFKQTNDATDQMDRMEATLTPAERDQLHGVGQTSHTPEEIREYRNALGRVDATSAEDLGNSLKWAITRVGQETDPAKMTHEEQLAYAQLREGARITKEQGLDPTVVTKTAIQGSASRFADPEDAAFMLRRFINEAASQVPEAPTKQQAAVRPALPAKTAALPAELGKRGAARVKAKQPSPKEIIQQRLADAEHWNAASGEGRRTIAVSMPRKQFVESRSIKSLTPGEMEDRLDLQLKGIANQGEPGYHVEQTKGGGTSRAIVYRDETGAKRAAIHFSVDENGRPAGVMDLYVDPALRRQGIATRLYEEAAKAGFDLSEASGGLLSPEGAAVFHARAVKRAVAEGKPVPPEVLAEYPDLGKRPARPERRQAENAAQRKRIEDITNVEEMRQEALRFRREARTDSRSGLQNELAWKETPKKAHVAIADVDGLGYINDMYGHAAGNALIEQTGETFRKAGLGEGAFRTGGDEFSLHSDDQGDLQKRLDLARQIQENAVISYKGADGQEHSFTGLSLSFGIGADEVAADAKLYEDKSQRTAAGQRATGKGKFAPTEEFPQGAPNPAARPPGLVEVGREGGALQEGNAAQRETPQRRADRGVEAGARTEVGPQAEGVDTTFKAGDEEHSARWAVYDAGDLTTSHTDQLNENPAYPAELQPRDRTRQASREQIAEMAQKLDPRLMGENPLAQHGAPIVGPDATVESGNARTIALRTAYEQGLPAARRYQEWLAKNAGAFGVNPAELKGIERPVLVRVRTSELTPEQRVQFTRTANARETAAMGAMEQAKADAERLTPALMSLLDIGETGEISAASNRPFVREFIGSLPTAEQGAMRTAEGAVSQEGMRRIRNAVFFHAYGDVEALTRLAESVDDPARNITNGMLRAAGPMVDLRARIAAGAVYPVDIAPDLTAAAAKLATLREQNESVTGFLAQRGMFGEELTPVQRSVLVHLDANKRSAKRIAATLADYADLAVKAGNPSSGILFEDIAPPEKATLWQAALDRNERMVQSEPGLFAEAGETVAEGQAATTPRAAARPAAGTKAALRPRVAKAGAQAETPTATVAPKPVAKPRATTPATKQALPQEQQKQGGEVTPSTILYHGTRHKFEGVPKPSLAQQWGKAVYFATDPRVPREEFGNEGGRVLEYTSNFKKPLHVPSPAYDKIVQQLTDESDTRYQTLMDRADAGDDAADRALEKFVHFDSSEPEGGAAIAERARKVGYDAIIAEHPEYGHEVAVLDTSTLRPVQRLPAPQEQQQAGPREFRTKAQMARWNAFLKRVRQAEAKEAERQTRLGDIGKAGGAEHLRQKTLPALAPPTMPAETPPEKGGLPIVREPDVGSVFDVYEAGYGREKLPEPSFYEKYLQTLVNGLTRDFIHLPAGQHGELKAFLRQFRSVGEITGLQAQIKMAETVRGLEKDPHAFDLFNFAIFARNLAAETARQQEAIAKAGRGEVRLPGGLTSPEVRNASEWLNKQLPNFPKVQEALSRRAQAMDEVANAFLKAGEQALGVRLFERLPDYFHQESLEYAAANPTTTVNGRKVQMPYRGWLQAREGSVGLYNTNWVEVEFKVLSQMMADTMRFRLLDYINRTYSITKAVKDQAKQDGLADWRRAIPEGYEEIRLEPNSMFYRAGTPVSRLLEGAVGEQLKEVGVQPVLLVGRDRVPMVLPTEIARTIRDLSAYQAENFEKAWQRDFRALSRPWKVIQIAAPHRMLGFQIRKEIGELEVALVNTGTYGKIAQATRDVVGFTTVKGRAAGPIAPELNQWMKRGGWHSLLNAMEHVGKGDKLRLLADFTADERNLTQKGFDATWGRLRLAMDVREAVTRYAVYLSYLDQMRRNPDGMPDNFGYSDPREIRQIRDIRDRAYKLADEVAGAYGSQSQFVQFLADTGLPVLGNNPFFRFQSVNTSRFVRGVRNIPYEVQRTRELAAFSRRAIPLGPGGTKPAALTGESNAPALPPPRPGIPQRGIRPIGGVPATSGGQEPPALIPTPRYPGPGSEGPKDVPPWNDPEVMRRVAMRAIPTALLRLLGHAVGPLTLFMIGRFLVRANALQGALTIFNRKFHPKELEDLPDYVRGRPVLILGRDKAGNVLYTGRLSAIEEVYSYGGLDNAAGYWEDYVNGRKTKAEIVEQMAKDGAGHFLQGGPAMQAVELWMGRKAFPDPFNPRVIQNPVQAVFQDFGLGPVYDHYTHTPQKPGAWWTAFAIHVAPKGEAAFDDMRGMAREYLQSIGKGDPGERRQPKGAAAYNYKRALQYNDVNAAAFWLTVYKANGGTRAGLAASMKSMDPLHALNDDERGAFILKLSPHDRGRLLNAYRYYARVMSPEEPLEDDRSDPYVERIRMMGNAVAGAIDRQTAEMEALMEAEQQQQEQQIEQRDTVGEKLEKAGLK